MRRIYLDYAATTPVDPAVEKAMRPYFTRKFGNPGSLHFFGQEAMAAVDDSRERIAKAVGADFREIIFTGSATEANNLALRGIVKNYSNILENIRIKPRIIVSAIEHESVLEIARDLEKEGTEVIYLPVSADGFIDLKKLEESLNKRTILISIMYANNEIGAIQPIAEISNIIKKNKRWRPLFHTDAVQAFSYLNCDVNKLGVDLMTLSAHKIYGPKGIGALYARQATSDKRQVRNSNMSHVAIPMSPIITGGGQEFGLRSGTENVPLIAGFAKAVELAEKNREKESKRVKVLRDYFWKEFKRVYPTAEINGSFINRLPNNLNVYWPGYDLQDIITRMDLLGIAVSAGSACSARAVKLSHVLAALGYPEERIKQSARFTFGKFTTKADINEALKRINPS